MFKKILATLFLFYSGIAYAWQPTNVVNIVVGFPPGGSTDLIARIIADGFTKHGIKSLVINKPGAGGVIATQQVAKSAQDGHTLLLTGTSFLINKILGNPGAQYDIFNDFTHLRAIGTVENRIYTNSKYVSGTLKDVIEETKINPEKYRWASTNPGAELTLMLLERRLNKKLTIVKYNGSAPALQDLAGGHLEIVIDSASGAFNSFSNNNNLRILGTVNEKNYDSRPSLDRYVNGVVTKSWFGLSAPRGVTQQIEIFYRNLIDKVLEDTEVKARLYVLGINITPQTPLEFFILNDEVRFNNILRPRQKIGK